MAARRLMGRCSCGAHHRNPAVRRWVLARIAERWAA